MSDVSAPARARAAHSPSSAAHSPSDGSRLGGDGLGGVLARNLDVPLVALATPLAIALGAPAFGCAVGAIAWVCQRALAQADRRWIGRAREARTELGLNLFEAFGRIWLLAGAIVLAGVAGGRADGLAAGVTIFGAYTIAVAIRVLSGPPPSRRRAANEREGTR